MLAIATRPISWFGGRRVMRVQFQNFPIPPLDPIQDYFQCISRPPTVPYFKKFPVSPA
ncbi:hypothetical protein L873DRAFT_1824361 [Choiromyces venosus 120613-1]|uniref:Uncharacterized protein n=1 Tax=Choiromyces venosus 120613-1 TaxID=1336337 RepID=A0A3N4IQV3_9PEZI|nr:hypothetical protein L873DRAFT_1824382 [Choiromyces venosus 120613-1]RPA88553.1 hypothetical protein L873DRAFT_1824361 [Choiromyces venosus 120613-1]